MKLVADGNRLASESLFDEGGSWLPGATV